MTNKLTPMLSALVLTGATCTAATLDVAQLGGIFPTYTDSSGFPGLTITFEIGQDPGTSENSGYSRDTGGMSLPRSNFPGGHIAVGPGDKVTFDFTNVEGRGGEVYVGFFDLDNSAAGGNESATVTSGDGEEFVPGAPGVIFNSSAHRFANITNVGKVSADEDGKIVIQAATAAEQGAAGTGYFAISVSTEPIPEPSTAILGLVGLAMFLARRRRA